LARVLGTTNFGIIHIGLAILSFALIFGNNGLTYLGTRRVASDSENLEEFTAHLLLARFALSLTVFVIGNGIIILLIQNPEIRGITLVYLLCLFPTAFLVEWYFQGRKQMGIIASGRLIAMLFYFTFIFFFVKSGSNLINVAWGWTIGAVANSLLLLLIFRSRNYKINFTLNIKRFKGIITTAFPMGIAELIAQVVTLFQLT
jgi:O-antigen/teichoic acid export membrane protein